jgi:asparagine synthase (glutamine-hydrolysing)
MCGIAGLFRPGGGDESSLAGTVARMTDTLAHRGPDGGGTWTSAPSGVALGHRRLAILDLSEAGAQPMRSDCGRLTVTFNGEIFNHLEIRSELEACGAAPNWRGHSDTETLLYAVRQWGVGGGRPRFKGPVAVGRWGVN